MWLMITFNKEIIMNIHYPLHSITVSSHQMKKKKKKQLVTYFLNYYLFFRSFLYSGMKIRFLPFFFTDTHQKFEYVINCDFFKTTKAIQNWDLLLKQEILLYILKTIIAQTLQLCMKSLNILLYAICVKYISKRHENFTFQ